MPAMKDVYIRKEKHEGEVHDFSAAARLRRSDGAFPIVLFGPKFLRCIHVSHLLQSLGSISNQL